MAVALFALVFACALDARAGVVVSEDTNELFTVGTSMEYQPAGAFDPVQSDEGEPDGPYNWQGVEDEESGSVVKYAVGAAYDYAAHGLVRNPIFETNETESVNAKYLKMGAQATLNRSIFPRTETTDSFSNVVIRTGARESIYCDMLTQFAFRETVPTVDSSARIIIWAQRKEVESDVDPSTVPEGETAPEVFVTNLMVTCGCFTNGYRSATPKSFRLDVTNALGEAIQPSKWYRLTVRAHGDVSQRNAGLSGFTVYLDGKPVRAFAEDYEISDKPATLAAWLAPEARALAAECRLFPGLVTPGSDASFTISGVTFFGECQVDDVSFSSDDPGYAKPEAVFTLNWDGGFDAPLKYTVDGGLTTNEAPVASARSRDILIGSAPTNGLTLKVTDFAYKTALNYLPGVWLGSNGATLTNGTEFVYDGTTRNPIATVASTRDAIEVGPGGYDTFKSALAALDRSTNEVKILTLNADLTVSTGRDAYGNSDQGFVSFTNPSGNYVLDLQGHTLTGSAASKNPTLVVKCASLRIVDTGDPDASGAKTGCIKPSGDYLNPTDRLNTAVSVVPQTTASSFVEPVLTIEAGIFDGWVRNRASYDKKGDHAAIVGAVFVEGGSFISTNGASFYLESCVTNASSQFIYRSGYWTCTTESDLVIWTGLGDGLHWTDPDNWKSHAVPKPTETALFPSRAEGLPDWTVDVETNRMTTTLLWLEGDVELFGTNDFTKVTMRAGCPGRFFGRATLVFDGDQPGKLTQTMLRDDWAGTVLVRNVGYPTSKAPKVLQSPETWGTASSTVVFNGVRGYVMDRISHSMPYALELRDYVYTNGTKAVTNQAWRNDSGYTGTTLAFTGSLLGDGTFQSGANARAILQLFKFADVSDYRGQFSVLGKRVLIGSETVMSTQPGLIAFGDHAVISSGLGWTCQYAAFGSTLHVWGATNDVIVTATKAQPDVTGCTNVTLNGYTDVAWLACTNKPKWSVYLTGERPSYVPALASASAPAAVFASVSAASLADDYTLAALRPAAYAMAVSSVAMADISIDVSGADVNVTVSNASRGLWYGIRHRASLDDEWGEAFAWTRAEGTTVTLTCAKDAEAGFYEVVASIDEPSVTGEGDGE